MPSREHTINFNNNYTEYTAKEQRKGSNSLNYIKDKSEGTPGYTEYDRNTFEHGIEYDRNPLYPERYDESYAQNYYYNMPDDYYFNALQLNPRQMFWIRRRKLRRDALDASMVEQNKNYIHESRHRHAMKRLRAPSGRFLTKEETLEFLSKMEQK